MSQSPHGHSAATTRTAGVSAVALTATLTLAMGVSTFPQYALGALGPFLTEDLALSRTALGSLTMVLFIIGGGLSPVAGPMVDRFGGRLLLLVLFTLGAAGMAAAAAAPSYPFLLVAIALAGLTVALGNPVTNQLLAVYVDPGRQGLLVGIKQSGVQIGAFLAGATLPPLAGVFGWRGALLASSLLAFVGVAAIPLTLPRPPRTPSGTRVRKEGVVGRLPAAVTWLAAYAVLMGIGVGVVTAYIPLYAVERLAFTTAEAGLVAALIGLVGVGARIFWGRFADRGATGVVVLLAWLAGGAIIGVGLVWGGPAVGSWALWAGAMVFGVTAIAWNAVGMLALVRDIDVRLAGRASGRVLLGFYGGFVVGPVAFGWTVDTTGQYTMGWALIMATFLAAALLTVAWRGVDPSA